jgi:hypothetical protein
VSVHPELADALLPVLAHAVRSSREPERRSGLSAVTTVLARHPEWHERLAALLPEVQFS